METKHFMQGTKKEKKTKKKKQKQNEMLKKKSDEKLRDFLKLLSDCSFPYASKSHILHYLAVPLDVFEEHTVALIWEHGTYGYTKACKAKMKDDERKGHPPCHRNILFFENKNRTRKPKFSHICFVSRTYVNTLLRWWLPGIGSRLPFEGMNVWSSRKGKFQSISMPHK